MLFCRLRLKFKIKIKKILTKKKQQQKTTQPRTTTHTFTHTHTHTHTNQNKKRVHTKIIMIKTHEKIQPKNLNMEKLYKNASHGIRTCANITGSRTEVLHVSTALFCRFIKHVKISNLNWYLILPVITYLPNNLGRLPQLLNKNSTYLNFMIFYAALWFKWNQKRSVLLNVLSMSFNTHR